MAYSYHDVVVIIDGKEIRVRDNFAYELTCNRVGGWQLWWRWAGKCELVGGEFDSKSFKIVIKPKSLKKETVKAVVCGRTS